MHATLKTILFTLSILSSSTCIGQTDDETFNFTKKGDDYIQQPEYRKIEKKIHKALLKNPADTKAHADVYNIYLQGYTSIPLMALYKMILSDYMGPNNINLYPLIDNISHRFITVTDTGNVVHVAPFFVINFDAHFENNVSLLEPGFLVAAALDFPQEHQNLNDAELLIEKFKTAFTNYPDNRKSNYGFYWTQYADYFYELSQTEHLKTASYMIFYKKGDPKVQTWVNSNPDKIDAFKKWNALQVNKLAVEAK